MGTCFLGPVVSTIEKFHCMESSQYIQYTVRPMLVVYIYVHVGTQDSPNRTLIYCGTLLCTLSCGNYIKSVQLTLGGNA